MNANKDGHHNHHSLHQELDRPFGPFLQYNYFIHAIFSKATQIYLYCRTSLYIKSALILLFWCSVSYSISLFCSCNLFDAHISFMT